MKYILIFKIIIVSIIAVVFLIPQVSMAVPTFGSHTNNLEILREKTGIEKIDTIDFSGRVIQIAFSVTGLVFLILMVYAGFRWMTARGNTENVEKAKNTIIGATLGLVLIVGAYAITNFITTRIIDKTTGGVFDGQSLGGEGLGCCQDRIGTSKSIEQWGCKVSTEGACKIGAEEVSSGDIFTEFNWEEGLTADGCSKKCSKLNEVF